ncbi:hydantoinase/oxoprolinase family protein [Paracoccus benzoatiresistens]|uniref:Hydantoinase/oxoprolinase family protein n=1 Tax=Paracoccus benzoatiresistens TaxID=2997341 RepID=A0ABT4J815_9RHOB|nr:hydantoinase/oxoprolinase family protein [Paracoccus sp. EF6]MCZ0963254.1 hydantoinase/oxoprolinase family protein [Paracoccus sp. EF6]
MARIGVDVGGTNTDLVLECPKGVFYHKVPTTLKNQSIGVVQGVQGICTMAGIDPSEVETIVHGTTTATNITIEHNGAECGMITTHGFRDILHIGRHKRPYNFSLHFDVPWQSQPLVKRRNRIAVRERILPPTGEIAEPLDEQAVRDACALFRKRGISSVVVGFMFSFLNDAHEARAKEIVLEEIPGAYVTMSSELARVMREYERFSTAAMNCYVGPKTAYYLRDLDARLREAGVTSKLRIMQSNGGVSTVESCARRPIRILMSGPAGGVIGGASEGEMAGTPNIITVDIGGTSADISTIPGGKLKIMNQRDTYVSGYPVLTPMIDLVTIGAGGGSVAFIDEAGAFNVGPRSAGSEPGPACYGRGGEEPTVTDAQIVLGRLDPDMALGGDLRLDAELSRKAVEEKIAKPLGMSVKDAALGIIKIINNNMALAIRSNSVARGIDPREFSIMPFGGAGPLHGVALAEAVSARDVIVPVAPGITAAVGLLKTDLQYEHTEAGILILNTATDADIARINGHIEKLCNAVHEELDADGIARDAQDLKIIAECRYQGQGFELRADFPDGPLTQENKRVIIDSFHDAHEQDYGYAYRSAEVELITLRVIGSASVRRIEIPKVQPTDGSSIDRALMFVRPTTFDCGRTLETPRYDRTKLYAGDRVPGPAILIQHNSTTLVPPGYVAETLDFGNTRISKGA